MNIYNDVDHKVCAWAEQLVAAGHVAPGSVLCKSIKDVQADEIKQATQVHFFAGILGWPLALRLAGWPDDRPVWTGSCPCQPFSAAGKRKGTADERHLWPDFLRLIDECRPATVFGEQVASSDGREWLAGVRTDLEALGYEVGAADLCAASVGAPHIRQRLFWVADAGKGRRKMEIQHAAIGAATSGIGQAVERGVCGTTGGVADAELQRAGSGVAGEQGSAWIGRRGLADGREDRGVGLTPSIGPQGQQQAGAASGAVERTRVAGWHDYRLIPCADGKSRRIEPSISPLAHGIPARVVRLRGYGNAIVPQVAAAFVRAFMESSTEAA